MLFVWLIVSILGATFVIYTAFLALCTAKAINAQGVETPLLMRLVERFWLVVGLPCDVIFNWTVGAWTFHEWRGFTFSSHIQQRVDAGKWDHTTAMWAQFLRAGDPEHIKRIPENAP